MISNNELNPKPNSFINNHIGIEKTINLSNIDTHFAEIEIKKIDNNNINTPISIVKNPFIIALIIVNINPITNKADPNNLKILSPIWIINI